MSNSNNYGNTNKKAKKEENWEQEFAAVRQYLLESPFSSEDAHGAVAAALNGIDHEAKRRHRDSKLHQKFATATTSAAVTTSVMEDYDGDAVKVERPELSSKSEACANVNEFEESSMMMMMTDDWHDVMTEEGDAADPFNQQNSDQDSSTSSSYLGAVFAKEAVAVLAAQKVHCANPNAALAVVLHATLLQAGFACTGVPEAGPSGGFAAPIRELPPGQFLPLNWEKGGEIQLRYRKEGTGSIVLTVAPIIADTAEPQVQVSLAPTLSKEPNAMQFAVADHINIDSWNRARKDKAAISPALHYKALATLLTKFAQHFDLGTVDDHADSKQDATPGVALKDSPYVDYTMLQNRQRFNHPATMPRARSEPLPDQRFPGPDISVSRNPDRTAPTTPLGDFSGDLMPTGIYPFPGGMPVSPGNLMGPNHPMFNGGGMSGVGLNSGFGMKPRFDPFGPPGGPTEPEDPDNLMNIARNPMNNNIRLPGGTGNPNNDLERPPHLSNNNMFL